jgi:AcrR family transcriptional regulator
MNKAEPSRNRRRGYNNALREEQARSTRERILEAVTAALAEGGAEGLSIAGVAARAGVSEPTIYRNFRSREGLIDALDEYVGGRLGAPPGPETPDGLPELVVALYQYFDDNAPLMRAALASGFARDVRAPGKRRRTEKVRQLLAPETAHLEAREANAVATMIRLLASADTWKHLVDDYELDSSDAARAVGWAAGALIDALRRARRQKRTTLLTEETLTRASALRKSPRPNHKER